MFICGLLFWEERQKHGPQSKYGCQGIVTLVVAYHDMEVLYGPWSSSHADVLKITLWCMKVPISPNHRAMLGPWQSCIISLQCAMCVVQCTGAPGVIVLFGSRAFVEFLVSLCYLVSCVRVDVHGERTCLKLQNVSLIEYLIAEMFETKNRRQVWRSRKPNYCRY